MIGVSEGFECRREQGEDREGYCTGRKDIEEKNNYMKSRVDNEIARLSK